MDPRSQVSLLEGPTGNFLWPHGCPGGLKGAKPVTLDGFWPPWRSAHVREQFGIIL